MILKSTLLAFCFFFSLAGFSTSAKKNPKTIVSIKGEKFLINNTPTYKGRSWQGHTIEVLLMNSRMVQGIFDNLNPKTLSLWKYPDTGKWNANRNTDEFIKAMDEW